MYLGSKGNGAQEGMVSLKKSAALDEVRTIVRGVRNNMSEIPASNETIKYLRSLKRAYSIAIQKLPTEHSRLLTDPNNEVLGNVRVVSSWSDSLIVDMLKNDLTWEDDHMYTAVALLAVLAVRIHKLETSE